MRLSGASLAGAILIVAAACSSAPSAPTGTGGTIEGTTWVLTSYVANGTTSQIPDGVVVDATFGDGQVAGSSGCNTYTGPATVNGANIKIGPVGSTQKACTGNVALIEQDYLAAMQNATTFTATDTELTIYDAPGTFKLLYAAGAANPLLGDWDVTGFNNGKQAVTSPIVGTELTASFTTDAVSGSSGCNTYNGGYTIDGGTVSIGPLASTMKACEAAIMDQEAQFLAALQASTTVDSTGGVVTLRDASGATQVTLAQQ